jgi:hypothetical protein
VLAEVAAPRQSIGDSVVVAAEALWRWRQRRQHFGGGGLGGGGSSLASAWRQLGISLASAWHQLGISLASAWHQRRRHNQQQTENVGNNGIGNGDNDCNKDDNKNKCD